MNFNQDMSQLITTSTCGTIKVTDMRTQKVLTEIEHPDLNIPTVCSSVGLSRNGQYLAVGGKNGSLFIFDLVEGKINEIFQNVSKS